MKEDQREVQRKLRVLQHVDGSGHVEDVPLFWHWPGQLLLVETGLRKSRPP